MSRFALAFSLLTLLSACGNGTSAAMKGQVTTRTVQQSGLKAAQESKPGTAAAPVRGDSNTAPSDALPADAASSSDSAPSSDAAPVAPVYAFRSSDAQGAAPAWKSSYVIDSTYAVYMAVDLPASAAGHGSLSADVFMPGNNPYEAYQLRYAAGVTAEDDEQQAEVTATGFRVWLSMPVAGTMIEQYGLSGDWTATAYLGSDTEQLTFNLQ